MENIKFIFDSSIQLWKIYINSSVAIVSIVGGFIISLMLNLSSQRQGIKSKLITIKNDIEFKTKEISKIKNNLGEKIAKQWVLDISANILKEQDIFSDILEKGGDFNKLFKKNKVYGLTEEELKSHYNRIYEIVFEFIKLFFEDNIDDVELDEDFDKYIKKFDKKVPKEKYKLWEKTYDYLTYLTKEKAYKEREKAPFKKGFNPDKLTNVPPSVSNSNFIEESNLSNLGNNLQSLLSQKRILESRKDNLKNELSKLNKPKGLIKGIILLIYFTLGGICYPISSQFFSFYNESHKYILFILFILGLILFLLYLAWLVKSISK